MHQITKISEETGINQYNLEMAVYLDKADPLKDYCQKFYIPEMEVNINNNDEEVKKKKGIYLCGNSLGLQPKRTRKYIEQELKNWEKLGVEAYFCRENPWISFEETCVKNMSEIVGANPSEVVLMNSLTVNLHLMLTAFYTPTEKRYKIVMEYGAFPSDNIAISSHLKSKGRDPDSTVVFVKPREGEEIIQEEDICNLIKNEGDEIALVFLGGVNYLTGQAFDIQKITNVAKSKGCIVGLDLAHAVGNIRLQLNTWGVDFAVWCSYKYLNAGPGGIGGCFVHERHAQDFLRPRLAGWWSQNKNTRFLMKPEGDLQDGAFGFQISTPPILCLASLKASLELYHEVGMNAFLQKRNLLTGYMAMLLTQETSFDHRSKIHVITPSDPDRRGCQLTLATDTDVSAKKLLTELKINGIICDFREPNCLRVAPNPFYNSFNDVFHFVRILTGLINNN